MSNSLIFLLDANVLINAARHYYAFDIAPVFWDKLLIHADDGKLKSIDHVKDEINRGSDELVDWVNGSFIDSFVPCNDPLVLAKYAEIMVWSQRHVQYSPSAKAEFAQFDLADSWLVAYAAVYNYVVVTHEEYNSTIRRRIPIPNVCDAFNVQYLNTFAMLRYLRVRLG